MAKMRSAQTVYYGPSTSTYPAVGSVSSGETITVLWQEGSWYHIQYEVTGTNQHKRGYVPASTVSNAGTVSALSVLATDAGTRYVITDATTYTGPSSTEYPAAGSVSRPEAVRYLGLKPNNFAFIEYDISGSAQKKRAYIYADNLGITDPEGGSTDTPGTVSKMASIALNEVGYCEKSTENQLDSKTENAGNGNFTKYGKWYGMQDEWCGIFVSWCANQAGILTTKSTGPSPYVFKQASVPTMYSCYNNSGRILNANTHTARVGDIAFIRTKYGDNGHIGIVVEVSGNTITTVEGNYDNKVAKVTYTNWVHSSQTITSLGR